MSQITWQVGEVEARAEAVGMSTAGLQRLAQLVQGVIAHLIAQSARSGPGPPAQCSTPGIRNILT